MDGDALAVALALGRSLGRPVLVVRAHRRAEPRPLAHHLGNRRVVEIQPVLDRVAAAVESPVQPDPAVGMAGDLAAPAVGLVDDGLELLDGQRGLRDEVSGSVDPRTVRHVDLEPVGAVGELLARGLARLDRPVDQLGALGHVELRGVSLQRIAARGRDRSRDHEHPRPRDVAPLDRLLDADIAVAGALGLDVADGREALIERPPGRDRRARRPQGRALLQQLCVVPSLFGNLSLQEDVRVCVDEARKHRRPREIDHGCARRNSGRQPVVHALDAVAANDDRLVVPRRRRGPVDERSGADHGRGLRLRRRLRQGRRRRNSTEDAKQETTHRHPLGR